MPQLDITSFFSQIISTFIILFLKVSILVKNKILFLKKILLNFKLITYYKKALNLQN